jgi:hypothetical protein
MTLLFAFNLGISWHFLAFLGFQYQFYSEREDVSPISSLTNYISSVIPTVFGKAIAHIFRQTTHALACWLEGVHGGASLTRHTQGICLWKAGVFSLQP